MGCVLPGRGRAGRLGHQLPEQLLGERPVDLQRDARVRLRELGEELAPQHEHAPRVSARTSARRLPPSLRSAISPKTSPRLMRRSSWSPRKAAKVAAQHHEQLALDDPRAASGTRRPARRGSWRSVPAPSRALGERAERNDEAPPRAKASTSGMTSSGSAERGAILVGQAPVRGEVGREPAPRRGGGARRDTRGSRSGRCARGSLVMPIRGMMSPQLVWRRRPPKVRRPMAR